MEKYLKPALEAVSAATAICMRIQMQLVSADTITKKDKSPVTIADYASQALICRHLNEHFPDVPIVGEEDSQHLDHPDNRDVLDKIGAFLDGWSGKEIIDAINLGNGEPNSLFWTLDPIDGTKGFLRGEQYAVALALIEKGEVVLGVLGCPNLEYTSGKEGTLLWAVRGGGTVAGDLDLDNSRTVYVSANSRQQVRFLESVEKDHANHEQQSRIMQVFGDRYSAVRVDSQVKYAVLAQGQAEVYLRLPQPHRPDYREKIWDHAAGAICVEEAGGMVTDIYGNALDFGRGKQLTENRGIIASNGRLHDLILENI